MMEFLRARKLNSELDPLRARKLNIEIIGGTNVTVDGVPARAKAQQRT